MIRCWRRLERAVAAVALAASVVACATQSGTVVLLPDPDGRDAALTVSQGDQTLVLDRPYAGANVTSAGPRAYAAAPVEVESRFGAALGAQPLRARTFTLYFVEQTDTFTDESKRAVESVIVEITRYPVPDIVVVGHTDTVGSDAFNDALARKRAETVRSVLIGRGVAPENVVAVGRGKREPAVATGDNVSEPRNRRVEIVVR